MNTRRPGFALATILILLGVALFSATAIVTVSTLESKISVSQREGLDAYYIAEAGVDDALWRLKTNDSSCGGSGCSSQLQAGTLNFTYSANNTPSSGKGFSYTMVSTSGLPAGNATITVVGSVAVTGFTAQRKIISNAYIGPSTSAIGQTALLSGSSISISNPHSTLTIAGGNLYGQGDITMQASSALAMGNNCIQSQGNFNRNNGTVTASGGAACVNAVNYAPTPPQYAVPGFSFSYYQTNNNASYDENSKTGSFDNAVQNGGSTVNFPGPVTYVNGNLNFANWSKSKTINITGMLVINGSLSSNNNLAGMKFNIIDPGNGKSGVFVSQNISGLNGGIWNINGVFYTPGAGSFGLNAAGDGLTVNGALVVGGSVNMNTGDAVSVTYNAARATAVFGSGAPSVLQVKHWEEQY